MQLTMVCVVSNQLCKWVFACINVIMRSVERCQSKRTKRPQKCHNQNLTVCLHGESLLNEWGRGVFNPGHIRAQVCPMLLKTLPAPLTNILLRKTRAKRNNSVDSGRVVTLCWPVSWDKAGIYLAKTYRWLGASGLVDEYVARASQREHTGRSGG